MKASRPEQQILVCIARRELDASEIDRLRRLASLDIDWDYLIATAKQHGLLPLLQKNLNSAAHDLLTAHARTRLKQESVANTQSMLYLASRAIEVSQLFSQSGIPTALFKGPILAESVYGQLGLRQAGDIDVLIPRERFGEAKVLLEKLGYEMYPPLTLKQLESHVSFHCEIQFVRDDWFTVIDLHWDLAPRSFVFEMTGEHVISRLQPVNFAGANVMTFCPVDLLLYQAMHGAKHLWRRLEWIACLAELSHSLDPAQWSSVVELAIKTKATKMLGLGLRLVETVFEFRAPVEVMVAVDGDESMKHFAQEISLDLFASRRDRPDSTDTNLNNLKIMDRKRDALISTLRAIFVPTLSDWQALSLPVELHKLYYAFRPLRLSKVYSVSLLRKLTHSSKA